MQIEDLRTRHLLSDTLIDANEIRYRSWTAVSTQLQKFSKDPDDFVTFVCAEPCMLDFSPYFAVAWNTGDTVLWSELRDRFIQSLTLKIATGT